MDFIMDLSNAATDRYFIVGDLLGDYERLINMLYQQKFSYKDTLIFTGNFIDPETVDSPMNTKQLETVTFLKNAMNAFSVKGRNEFNFLRKVSETGVPAWMETNKKHQEILKFIEELPLIIRVSDYIYVVNAGVQPNLPLNEQDPEVFYSIGGYDPDSRFYQFENPEQKSWCEFDIYDGGGLMRFCFGGKNLNKIEFPAGYCLGREAGSMLTALIIRKNNPEPIIIQS